MENCNTPTLPIPISLISGRYFLFSADAVTYVRREYNLGGVLIGTLPQVPQQNVFLGLPLELMPEEARLLVEKQAAYIVDDVKVHTQGMGDLMNEDRKRYLLEMEQLGRQASLAYSTMKEQRRDRALKNMQKSKAKRTSAPNGSSSVDNDADLDETLFSAPKQAAEETTSSRASLAVDQTFGLTPASSETLFPNPSAISTGFLPDAPASYPLFAHLHSEGYFLSPGLRFGCQYLAYPGDSLRFHSHFLVSSAKWDEEIDLMQLVAGGRLGTGVKKGYLIGGAEESSNESNSGSKPPVRTFSIEWAGI